MNEHYTDQLSDYLDNELTPGERVHERCIARERGELARFCVSV